MAVACKALTTFGLGPHAAFVPTVLPGFTRYAARHQYDLVVPSAETVRGLAGVDGGLPPSWLKVPLLLDLLGRYEAALWLDADVCVVDDGAPDLLGFLGDGHQAVAFHEADVGLVPNCGVWVVTRRLVATLETVWSLRTRFASHGWWEQAALMELMGMKPDDRPVKPPSVPNTLFERTAQLPATFNWHPRDTARPDAPYFAHATTLKDRGAALRHWAADGFTPILV